jgi:hypothetical protein
MTILYKYLNYKDFNERYLEKDRWCIGFPSPDKLNDPFEGRPIMNFNGAESIFDRVDGNVVGMGPVGCLTMYGNGVLSGSLKKGQRWYTIAIGDI